MEGVGYVAITNTIEHDVVDLSHGSPVFQVTADDTVNVVQYFSMPFQNRVYLGFVFSHLDYTYLCEDDDKRI